MKNLLAVRLGQVSTREISDRSLGFFFAFQSSQYLSEINDQLSRLTFASRKEAGSVQSGYEQTKIKIIETDFVCIQQKQVN